MTYRELLEKLKTLNEEQLDCDVVLVEDSVDGELYPGTFDIVGPHDCLDEDHPIIKF